MHVSFMIKALFLVKVCSSDLVFTRWRSVASIPLYPISLWNSTFHDYNVVLVDLTMDIHIFDYCNLEGYSIDNVRPLLEAHYINMTAPIDKWIAVHPYAEGLSDQCVKLGRSVWSTDFIDLYWPALTAPYIQRLGKIFHYFILFLYVSKLSYAYN
jgi:hypothetical protein